MKLSSKDDKMQCQRANLQSDYNNKLQAYKSVKDSFARKIETEIIASNPAKYISSGVKNWTLLNNCKHVAWLQKKCINEKLPPMHIIVTRLLKAVCKHETIIMVPHAREKVIYP